MKEITNISRIIRENRPGARFRRSFGMKVIALLLMMGLLVTAANLWIVLLVEGMVKSIARDWVADASLRAIKRIDERLSLIDSYTAGIAHQTQDLLRDHWKEVKVSDFDRYFTRDKSGALTSRVRDSRYVPGDPSTYPEILQAFAPAPDIYQLTPDDKKFLLIAEKYSFPMLRLAREALGTQWVYLVHDDVSVTYPFSDTELSLDPNFRYSTRPYARVIREFDGQGMWTDPYVDASGAGWMITRSHPIVFQDRPFGMAVQDVVLRFINESLLDIQFNQAEFQQAIGDDDRDWMYRFVERMIGAHQDQTRAFMLKQDGQLLTTNDESMLDAMTANGGVYYLWPGASTPDGARVDASGVYSPELLTDEHGHPRSAATFVGDDILYAYPLKSTGWYVLVQVDAAQIFAAVDAIRVVLLTVTAAGILLSVGLGYFFSRRFLTNRVITIAAAAKRAAAGDYHKRVPDFGADEIGYLGRTFNSMMEGLLARQREREVFGHYVSTTIRDKILKHPDALSGEEVEAVVLFSDIRSFSTYSETRHPHEVVSMLNRHFSRMVDIIQANGGIVDKFMGDAVMAVFGAYLGTKEPHRAAVKSAVEMRRRLTDLNREFVSEGKPPIDIGIGIHAGPALAGNIGSANRKQFTVIGNTVDIAARLESETKALGHPILISSEVHEHCGAMEGVRFVDTHEIPVKGKKKRVRIYRVEEESG